MANLAYYTVKLLRKDGLDVELLMQKNPPKGSNPLRFHKFNQKVSFVSFQIKQYKSLSSISINQS